MGKQKTTAIPECLEIERMILCALLQEKYDHTHPLSWKIKPGMFFKAEHKALFEAISTCFEKRRMTKKSAVIEQLTANEKIEAAGGLEYIHQLHDCAPENLNVGDAVKTLIETNNRRQIIQASNMIEKHASSGADRYASHIYKEIDNIMNTISSTPQEKEEQTVILEQVLDRVSKMIGKPFSLRADDFGLETGFESLDNIIGGFQQGTLYILAGRPAMGMTNLALQMALHAAINKKTPVGFLDFEAAPENLLFRATSSLSGIDLHMLRQGTLTESDWQDIFKAHMDIMSSEMHFITAYSRGDSDLLQKIDAAIRQHGLKLLIIDSLNAYALSMAEYLQMPFLSPKISFHLKRLCQRYKIPIVCTMLLGSSADQHEDKFPRLTDIHPSYGCVENADVIMFLTRPAMYMEPEEVYDDDDYDDNFVKAAFVKVARNRNGPVGGVTLMYENECGRFTNLTEWDVEFV